MNTLEHQSVLIVGGGPAGSSLAIRLAQAGLDVSVIEQKNFPRPKLCGEFISPECVRHFSELGVLEDISTIAVPIDRTVFYARNGRAAAVPSDYFASGSHALGLSRAEMDARLLERAKTAGAKVFEDMQAGGPLFEDEKVVGIRVKQSGLGESEMAADLTIDATGRSRILVREIEKIRGLRSGKAAYVAFKAHLDGAALHDGDCEIYAYRGGYGGCSRVEKGLYNICFIVSARIARKFRSDAGEIMRQVVCANNRASDALRNARPVSDWLAVPIERYGRSSLAPAEGLLAIGDSAAFIDPFTGSGILLALESGKIAADAITELIGTESQSFTRIAQEYRARYSAAFDRRLHVSSWIRRAAFVPLLAESVIRALALSDSATRLLARATRQDRSASSFPQG